MGHLILSRGKPYFFNNWVNTILNKGSGAAASGSKFIETVKL